MLYNHARQRVEDWSGGESRCPECGGELLPRRGEFVVWHWAHRPGNRHGDRCPHRETRWHLVMKLVYASFRNWNVEVPLAIGGKTYRVDAMNARTGRVREFVHSLSPFYLDKHLALKRAGYDVRWIMDGDEHHSKRVRRGSDGRLYPLLKPRAYEAHKWLDCHVHWDADMLREWRGNVWFPRSDAAADEVIQRFHDIKGDLLRPEGMPEGAGSAS